MRKPVERQFNRENILNQTFACLVENGLENVSVRGFSEYAGLKTSSLYYWFKDKDEIVIDSIEYAASALVKELFEFAVLNLENAEVFSKGFISLLKDNGNSLKLIIQVTTSPKYGKRIVEHSKSFDKLYDLYTEKVEQYLDVPYDNIRTLIDLLISATVDCVIWEDWDKLEREISCIIELVIEKKRLYKNSK